MLTKVFLCSKLGVLNLVIGDVMQKADVVEFFGSQQKVAEALGIAPASVCQWGETIPPRRAYEIERLTNGALVVPNTPKPLSKTA